MQFLDLTLPTPEENLAMDEVLLDLRDQEAIPDLLRVWQPSDPFIVVGLGNPIGQVVHEAYVKKCPIPILRRVSGGGAVVLGSGTLNYSLIAGMDSRPQFASVTSTNAFALIQIAKALHHISHRNVEWKGCTDLVVGERKCVGSAQKRKRHALLFHGTILLHFDLNLIDTYLRHPPREPEYRNNRSHRDFVMNLDLDENSVIEAIREVWKADELEMDIPFDTATQLARTKYSDRQWNFRRF